MSAKQVVKLTDDERRQCHRLIRAGTAPVRSILHAQVLLKTDASAPGPGWTDAAIAQAFNVSTVTVATIRKTMFNEGLPAALRHYRKGQRQYPRKLDGHGEAHLVALACSAPPEGYLRWSVRLLSKRFVELGYVDVISHDTVWQTLKKKTCSLGAPGASASRRTRTPPS
jgi:CelD/BcsL family acetyltransferase involved in cellulose biosynthesis